MIRRKFTVDPVKTYYRNEHTCRFVDCRAKAMYIVALEPRCGKHARFQRRIVMRNNPFTVMSAAIRDAEFDAAALADVRALIRTQRYVRFRQRVPREMGYITVTLGRTAAADDCAHILACPELMPCNSGAVGSASSLEALLPTSTDDDDVANDRWPWEGKWLSRREARIVYCHLYELCFAPKLAKLRELHSHSNRCLLIVGPTAPSEPCDVNRSTFSDYEYLLFDHPSEPISPELIVACLLRFAPKINDARDYPFPWSQPFAEFEKRESTPARE
jgi:hypothetical protein